MLLIRCISSNNLRIDTVWPSVSNDFSCFCWPGTNTWTQDIKASVSAKPADMEGRGKEERKGRSEVEASRVGRCLFHSERPEVRIVRQGRAQCGLTKYMREKVPTAETGLPNAKMFWYVIFYSADVAGIEYLGLSQQMWSHTQASTDLSLCLFFQDYSPVFFFWREKDTNRSHRSYTTAARANKRIQDTSKGTGRDAKENNMSHMVHFYWGTDHVIIYYIYIIL